MDTGPSAIGRYQVRARLGQGGMGVLYLALDPAIDRLIAVKLLRVVDDELRERFLREARLAARLQHPNIVTIFDVGSHEGQPFIAMEYIAGETLAELIQRKAPLALLRKLELALDACQGLAYAHKNGIVHRDIKPANLMVSRDAGVLKVLDFGIARGADSTLTQIGMLMGTPNYMAPEQIEGKPIDQRADIFAVGLVLYELLVYRQAFKAETPHAVLHQVLHQSPKPLRELDAGLDASLVSIVERAIAKDPSKRYGELERLRGDLVRVVQRLKTEVDADTVAVPAAEVEAARQGGRRELDRQRLAERRAAQIATHLAAAEAALSTNDADAALAAAESAALLAPEDPKVVAALDRAKTAIELREIAAFMSAAREHMRAGEMTEAGEAVMEALQIDPRHADAQALRIEIDRAVEERERARERARAVARALAQAEQSLAAGAVDAALRATGEALGHDPSSPDAQAARAKVLALVDRQAERVIALAREHFAADRHALAIHVLEEFSPWHESVETELATLKREIAALLQRRAEEEARRKAEEEARIAREAEQAIATARAHFAADRHAEAVRVLEAFSPRVERVDAELVTLKRDIAAELQRRAEEEARRKVEEARIAREAEQAIATARKHFAADRHAEAVRVLEAFSPRERVDAELVALKRDIAAELQRRAEEEARRKAEEARIAREAERTIATAREHFAAGRDAEAVRALEQFSPRHESVDAALVDLKHAIAAELQRRRDEEARIAREAEQAIAEARRHFAADRHADAVRVLEQFSPQIETVETALVALRRDIAAVQQRRAEEEARRRAEEEARLLREAERALASAREHFAADRHAEAVRVLEQFSPRHQRIDAELLTLKRDIAAARQRRAEEDARVAREAEQAIAAAREHFAADRHADAVRVLEQFSPQVETVETALVALRRDIATVQQRRAEEEARRKAEEEARLLREAEGAIASAREHFAADRHAEAVRVLEQFSPRHQRIDAELLTLKRDIAAARQRRAEEDARIAREAERAIATARKHFAADRHADAVRVLEEFLPHHQRVEAELVTLKRDIAAEVQRRAAEEARRKAEEEARIAREAERAIKAARAHVAADRHVEAVRVLEEFSPRQERVDAELAALKRDIAAVMRRREEEDARKRAEAEAKRKAEEARLAREAEEARKRAEAEARKKAEEQARLKAAEDARLAREAEETRKRAEAEARRKVEEDARRAKEAEEARKRGEQEARKKAEEDARLKAAEEARLAREAEEARQRAEEEARIEAAEQARLAKEAEAEAARKRADDEARRRREADAQRAREAEEARKAAEAQAARLREEEAARKKAAEARLAREAEDARKRAEERAARLKEAEDARIRAEEEARRVREAEEARLAAEAEARRQREAEAAREREEDTARQPGSHAVHAQAGAEARGTDEPDETHPQAEAAANRDADVEARGRDADDTQRTGKQDARKRAGDEWKRKPGKAAKAAQKAAAEKAAADKALAAKAERDRVAAERLAAERAAADKAASDKAASDKAARDRDAAARLGATTAGTATADEAEEATQRVAVPESLRRAAATATTAGATASTRGARDRQAREAADSASSSPSPLPAAGASSNTMLYGGIGAAVVVIALVGWFAFGGSNPAPDTQKQGTQVADGTLKPTDPAVTPGGATGPGAANPGTPGSGTSPATSPGTVTPGANPPAATDAPATASISEPSGTAKPDVPPPPLTASTDANPTDPNAAANAAAAREKAIDGAVADVRRMIDRRQRQQALDLLGQHLMTYQNTPKLTALLTEMVNTAQRDADRARTDALRARAAERAVPELQRAENTLRDSTQLRQRNRQVDAARSYWRAQDEFAEAGRLAATRPATLPTTPVTTTAQANNPPPSSQQLPQPPTTQQNPPVTPPSTQVKPEQPTVRPEQPAQVRREPAQPPAQTVDSRGAVQQALNRYAAAHASLSAAQVASVYRTMNPKQMQSLDSGFRQQNSHNVSVSNCSIKDNGDRATAQCTLRREIVFKNGQRFDRSNAATFDLEKRGNEWVIIGIAARD